MSAIDDLAKAGTSTWLDDLSRDRLDSGNLAELIDTKSIVGVTTNPAIFASAMSRGTAYDDQIKQLKKQGAAADEAVYAMAIEDVRRACDVFQEVYRTSGGKDGRVSIEVDPRISEDTDKTIAQARDLWKRVDRPNAMIKIPATPGSLPAVTEALAEGISVNVTLIFSVECYRQVWDAFSEGIRRAKANGLDVTTIHSVASLFVSRVDTEVDKRLDAIGTPQAKQLKGKAGIANARRAYAAFKQLLVSDQVPAGANIQRPLWASTGVKDPAYPADMYVVELAGPNTVNTMPEPTIDAALDGNRVNGDTLTPNLRDAEEVFRLLADTGIDFDDVFAVLEREGVEKFVDSWNGLLTSMDKQLGN